MLICRIKTIKPSSCSLLGQHSVCYIKVVSKLFSTEVHYGIYLSSLHSIPLQMYKFSSKYSILAHGPLKQLLSNQEQSESQIIYRHMEGLMNDRCRLSQCTLQLVPYHGSVARYREFLDF